MSGFAFGTKRTPADIVITPIEFNDRAGTSKKKSNVDVIHGSIGPNLRLGFLIKTGQQVALLRFTNKNSDPAPPCPPLTGDQWKGVLGALAQFMPPAADEQWVLFDASGTGIVSGFTSELVLDPPPTPPKFQNVTVVGLHADEGADQARVYRDIQHGRYGYGVSVVRARNDDWPDDAAKSRRQT